MAVRRLLALPLLVVVFQSAAQLTSPAPHERVFVDIDQDVLALHNHGINATGATIRLQGFSGRWNTVDSFLIAEFPKDVQLPDGTRIKHGWWMRGEVSEIVRHSKQHPNGSVRVKFFIPAWQRNQAPQSIFVLFESLTLPGWAQHGQTWVLNEPKSTEKDFVQFGPAGSMLPPIVLARSANTCALLIAPNDDVDIVSGTLAHILIGVDADGNTLNRAVALLQSAESRPKLP